MEVTRDWQMKRKMSGQGEIIRYSKLKERKEKKAMPVYNRIPWHACEPATPRTPCHPGNTSLTAVPRPVCPIMEGDVQAVLSRSEIGMSRM